MCRFTLYLGPPVRLSTLLTEPEHSLILQSYHSTERDEPLNGDGFGVGWYAPRLHSEPALFHEITPAWNNRNLRSIARVVASPCVLAHVRAASPGSDVNLANCHPFGHGGYLMMHNGNVGGFRKLRRELVSTLSDEAFDVVRGSTDTEHLFAVFIDEIIRHGCPVDPGGVSDGTGEGARELALRLVSAIRRVLGLSRGATPPPDRGHAETAPPEDGAEASFLNVAVSDGAHAAVCRFTNHPHRPPESLYYLHGELYEPAGRRFPQRRAGDEGEAVVVSSERLTDDPRWKEVPPGTVLALDRRAPPQVLELDGDGKLME